MDAKSPEQEQKAEATKLESAEYEAPKVESVLTADELAREIQYAGVTADE